jgi:hypothetical protein
MRRTKGQASARQPAGSLFGSAAGSNGKVQTPCAKKLLGVCIARSCGVLGTVGGIAPQEFLGEIREIVLRVKRGAVAKTDHGDLLS